MTTNTGRAGGTVPATAYNPTLHAGVAQLVEQRIRNAKVGSSTLLTGTKHLSRSQRSEPSVVGFLLSGPLMSSLSTAPRTTPRLARIVLARRRWQWLLAVLMLLVCYLAFSPMPPPKLSTGWDKLNHVAAFVALSVSACLGFAAQQRTAWPVLLGLLAFGGGIELVQAYVPGRDCEWADLAADAIGIVAGALIALPLLRAVSPRPC
jgi:VanZ family protein